MANMTNGAKTYVAIQRNNFQGNGNCDETREANKRASRVTGMESEIAPYYGPTSPTGMTTTTSTTNTMDAAGRPSTSSTVTSVTTAAPAESREVGSDVAERQMAAMDAAENRSAASVNSMTAHSSVTGDLVNDGYGTEYVHTEEAEEGMSSFPQDSFTEPLTASEAARNSWRALLARNVGRTVLVRFLVGTQNVTTVEGELYEVGTDYIVIYQPLWDSHITADLYMVKFVEFREPTGVISLD